MPTRTISELKCEMLSIHSWMSVQPGRRSDCDDMLHSQEHHVEQSKFLRRSTFHVSQALVGRRGMNYELLRTYPQSRYRVSPYDVRGFELLPR
jgi:hypothetical protein